MRWWCSLSHKLPLQAVGLSIKTVIKSYCTCFVRKKQTKARITVVRSAPTPKNYELCTICWFIGLHTPPTPTNENILSWRVGGGGWVVHMVRTSLNRCRGSGVQITDFQIFRQKSLQIHQHQGHRRGHCERKNSIIYLFNAHGIGDRDATEQLSWMGR